MYPHGRVLAQHVEGPGFELQYHKKFKCNPYPILCPVPLQTHDLFNCLIREYHVLHDYL